MSLDRKKWKEKLLERQKDSYNTKDDSGRFKSIFKQLPEKYSMFKCSEDEHIIDIIPYIAGDNNSRTLKGDPTYNLDLFVHRGVGPNEDTYICLSRTFKQPCPICEHKVFLTKQDEFDEKEVKLLNPTRRCIYNIWVHDNDKEEAKGVQIWDVSQYLFEKELASQARLPKGGGFVPFSDPDDGKSISFVREGKSALATKYKSFHFLDREEPIPDEILGKALCLDELIYKPSYEEVYDAFHSSSKENEEESFGEEKVKEESEKDIPDFPINKEEIHEDSREARRRMREERKSKDNPCPHGHEFGKDIDNFDECEKCESLDECEKKADELLEKKEEIIKEEIKKEEPKRTLTRRPGK